MNLRAVPLSCLIFVAGCNWFGGSSSSDVLTQPPSNWQTLQSQKVTLEGSAGNSPTGPILRFQGGSWIGLEGAKQWGLDAVGRPVGVTGVIQPGVGARNGEYVMKVESWYIQNKPDVPREVESTETPKNSTKKPK